MFSKKRCKQCGEKFSEKYSYFPNCGLPSNANNSQEDEDEWGMFGKNDSFGFEDAEIKLPFGFNALFNSLVKSLDKQMKEFDKQLGKEEVKKISQNPFAKSGGIGINISSSSADGKPPKIIVKSFGNIPEFKEQEKIVKKQSEQISRPKAMSEKKAKQLSKLPRKEPKTNIKRLNDKVIYEIDIPGVKSEKDISIIQLENSIEIKAVGKKEAYFKLIPINLPILKHKLLNGKLVLELEARD